ncbi:hypothetical protein CRUP_013029, partial [Coryphaenoides rupestris]
MVDGKEEGERRERRRGDGAPSCLLLLMPRFGKDFKMFDAILPTLRLDITDLLDDSTHAPATGPVHSHRKRQSHLPDQVRAPEGSWAGPLHGTRQLLELFAVTCIETSHYVSLVKHGPRPSDWLFFDSMADREGGPLPRLSEEALSRVDPASLPEPARRLLCDAYMCFYHSPQLSLSSAWPLGAGKHWGAATS